MLRNSLQLLAVAALGVALISCSSNSAKGPLSQTIIQDGSISGPIILNDPVMMVHPGGLWMSQAFQMQCRCRIMVTAAAPYTDGQSLFSHSRRAKLSCSGYRLLVRY